MLISDIVPFNGFCGSSFFARRSPLLFFALFAFIFPPVPICKFKFRHFRLPPDSRIVRFSCPSRNEFVI